MNIVIATTKSWNIKNSLAFKEVYYNIHETHLITDKNELSMDFISRCQPDFILFPHWSWKIPKEIYEQYTCIVFHMTDLPFGRGGSPLQNLIARNIESTMISAIRVDGGMDTGDIYLKESLNLNGTAEEIFIRASNIIFSKMIPKILEGNIIPIKQDGEPIVFKRRSPQESELRQDFSLNKIYDYIRMLDCEGYPRAFIQFGQHKILFSRASFKNGKIIADVEIIDEGGNHEE